MIELVKRCANGYDIYLRHVSRLSYAPNVYAISLNGRFLRNTPTFATLIEAEDCVRNIQQEVA